MNNTNIEPTTELMEDCLFKINAYVTSLENEIQELKIEILRLRDQLRKKNDRA